MIDFRSNIAIAMGGNLPFEGAATAATLVAAVGELANDDVLIRGVSRFFQTPCFPTGAGPDYVNAVISVQTVLSPHELLHRLHGVESNFGRARAQRWGMRTLDLDILAYDQAVLPIRNTQERWMSLPLDQQINTVPDELILPHPRLQDRPFALIPMCDIMPDWVHPVLKKTARELSNALPPEEIEAVRPI